VPTCDDREMRITYDPDADAVYVRVAEPTGPPEPKFLRAALR
jgi:uncharacterized protein YuzE